ncbi:MAG: ribbon-helix-helix protein, CopG family [Bacteroidetes bacterium]|nr:ribbon-helix-helix protein, CopG family [Bacteroidota bacterium]
MTRSTRTLTVSLPAETYKEIEDLAKQERRTKSELFREMVRVYEDYLDERRWKRLQRYGREAAERAGIKSEEDIERIVHEIRGIKE